MQTKKTMALCRRRAGLLLLMGVVFALLAAATVCQAEETFVVVRKIAPVMREPAPYKTFEEGIEGQEGIDACVYYGSRVTVAPAKGKHAGKWVLLRFNGETLGYVEKNALKPFPKYTAVEPEAYTVKAARLPLFLLPGEYPADRYSKFYLPQGVTVTGIGTAKAKGDSWVLLRFSSVGYYADNPQPADVQTRYAWARERDLIRLASYSPDLSKVEENRVPSEIMTWQSDGMENRISLGDADRKRLVQRGFFVDPKPVLIEYPGLDDLVEAYPQDRTHVTPLFLTADLGLHVFHLIFDRMLQKAEEQFFAPALADLLTKMRQGVRDRKTEIAASDRGKDVYAVVDDYLAVAQVLLSGDGADALSPRARIEYDRILAAAEKADSSFSGQKDDYTLFKPRGHYTLTPELERYFRAMSLLGGVTFTLKGDDEERVLRNTGVIGVLCTLIEDPAIQSAWKKLFDPFTYLVGTSNDNSWYDFGPVVRKEFGGFPLGDVERMRTLNKELVAASRPPLILGKPAPHVGASQQEREDDALGYRFIGRRFTFDALVFNVLTSPRTGNDALPRNLPDPLDVMAVFGSKAALEETKAFEEYANYASNQTQLRERWAGFDEEPLAKNVYSGLLRTFSDYFEPTGSGQFFSRSPEWEYKKLTTASAAWAELKHDTILYGEQSGAEMGDGGDVWYAPDFLFPEPRGFVEPEPRLFQGLAAASDKSREFLSQAGWTDEEYPRKLETFAGLMKGLAAIGEKETTGAAITDDDYRFIREFPAELNRELILPENMLQLYPPLSDEAQNLVRMALVADVASDYLAGRALHVAVGAPRYLYVFVDDASGGPRVTRGAMFSFYSFARPLADGRMTDEAWKKMVYGGDAKTLESLRPDWARKMEK